MINSHESSWIALYKKLQECDESSRHELLSFLPESRQKEAGLQSRLQSAIKDFSLEELIARIDPSWFEEALQGFSARESALLKKPPLFQKFFQAQLLHTTFGDLPLPPSYLPAEDPLTVLLEANGKELEALGQLLGLYDLIWEVKKVIRASQFQQIESALTERELLFLSDIRQDRNNTPLFEMGLAQWNGDHAELRVVLRSRGFFRLAKALSFSSSDLTWYILHALPKEMALEIESFSERIENLRLHTALIHQTLHAWNFLCTASH